MNLSKGPHKNHVACNMPKRIANEENSDRIKDFMEQNPTLSIRRAENDLEIPRATVGFYTYIDLILNFPLDFSPFFSPRFKNSLRGTSSTFICQQNPKP